MDIIDDLWDSRHPHDALFLSIIEGCEIISEKFKDSYIKDNICLFTKFEFIIILNTELWELFKQKFDLLDYQISQLLDRLFKDHLNIEGYIISYSETQLDTLYFNIRCQVALS